MTFESNLFNMEVSHCSLSNTYPIYNIILPTRVGCVPLLMSLRHVPTYDVNTCVSETGTGSAANNNKIIVIA